MIRKLLPGVIPAFIYIAIASFLISTSFECDGGLGMSLCGYGPYMLTWPSQLTIGRIFAAWKWKIDFMGPADSFDVAQLAVHIGFCALLIFLVGFGLGWFWRRFSSFPLSD